MTAKKIRTMEQFARSVGLSRPTVSKFFHDPASVRAKTRSRIESELKRSGFRPNLFAVNLNRRRSKIIGVIIPDPLDPFYMALAQRVETSAVEAGYLALVLSTNGRPDSEQRAIETITSLNVAGALIAPVGEKSHRTKLKALGKNIPLVFVDSPLDDDGPFVGTNNHQSIPLITEYLCRTGERPTFFGSPVVNRNASERRKAYELTMKRLGLQPAFARLARTESWDFERISFQAATEILRNGGFATRTILCANDRVAFGVLAAIHQAGLKIGIGPDCDYRVAGHDNQPLSAFTCPPLTTVSQDFARMGQLAFDLLVSKIGAGSMRSGSGKTDERILLNAELVFRKSA